MIYTPDIKANLIQLVINCGLAAAVTTAIVLILKAQARWWVLAAVFVVLTAFTFMYDGHREAGFHGFMHASYVYAIMEQGLPPEDPLFAGEPLRYPYLLNGLLAQCLLRVAITPGTCFALVNLLALSATIFVIYRTAVLIRAERTFCILAVVLALIGGPFIDGPVVGALELIGIPREVRHLPYSKFHQANSNQIGYLCFAIALYASLRLFCSPSRRRPPASSCRKIGAGALLCVATAAAMLFYMFSWLLVCMCVGASAAVMLASPNKNARKGGFYALIAVALSSAACMPYILSIVSERSSEGSLSLAGVGSVLRSLEVALLALAPAATLSVIYRDSMVAEFRKHVSVAVVLLVWFSIPCLLSIIVLAPVNNQYKFLSHALLPWALITAIAIEAFYRSRKTAAIVFIFMLSVALTWRHATIVRTGWPAIDPTWADGAFLRHADTAEDTLYAWIAKSTPVNAVFLDTQLTIPTFGRRSLYVGLNWRRERLMQADPRVFSIVDGWDVNAVMPVEVGGHARPKVEQRRTTAAALLSADSASVEPRQLAQVLEDVPARSVYIVARDPSVRCRLRHDQRMDLAYEGDNASVFLIAETRPVVGR